MTLKEYECSNCQEKFPEDLDPDKSAKMYVKYIYIRFGTCNDMSKMSTQSKMFG